MTKSQENEIEVWEYFIPKNVKWLPKTDKDIKMFFEWSEQGKHKDRQMVGDLSYFEALRQGKRWAGIHVHELYEPGVLEGDTPYFTILGGYEKTVYRKWWQFWKPEYWFEHSPTPRNVVNFLKGEMFRGKDKDIIEACYLQILKECHKNKK
jgi:hypothetical protein